MKKLADYETTGERIAYLIFTCCLSDDELCKLPLGESLELVETLIKIARQGIVLEGEDNKDDYPDISQIKIDTTLKIGDKFYDNGTLLEVFEEGKWAIDKCAECCYNDRSCPQISCENVVFRKAEG